MVLDRVIRFRCSQDTKKAIEYAAKAAGKSVSTYIQDRLPVATSHYDEPIVATKPSQPVATKRVVCLLKKK